MLETFTKDATSLIYSAKKIAKRKQSILICEPHLLWAFVQEEEGIAAKVLKSQEIPTKLVLDLNRLSSYGHEDISDVIYFSDSVQEIIDLAQEEASYYGHPLIDVEHILLAVMHDNILGYGISEILKGAGLDFSLAKRLIIQLMADKTQEEGVDWNIHERVLQSIPTVRLYGLDLSREAMKGLMDPVIGRSKEIARVTQVVGRRSKSNPCLLGEPGVGKTAIAEGLALRIVSGDVPRSLKYKFIMSLDVGRMIAGTKYRGEFEGRLTGVVSELKKTKLVILLIDEVHTVVTAGSAEGALGAGNMLKPSLARGELQVLGATTFTEYTKYIEKDAAMERRFQPVKVPEPSAAETLEILYGIRSKYENHHNVVIEDDALRAAAELSERHINDRFLPDKAIDLVDQSSSRAQVMGLEYSPEVVDLKSKLEKLTTAKSKALRQKDFRKAMTFKREEKRLNKKLRTGLHKLRVKMAKMKKLSEVSENQTLQPIATVDKKMVVECVSIWTRTPIHEVTSDELATLNEIRDKMNEVVIAQELAVECVACAVRRARTALRPEGRPLANFLFCGPTGVGKTELAKVCCTFFFGSSDRMVRFDMSEYTERHSVAKMIGSPPGYQGYEDTGRLTESVRNTPYTMILFDEVEKAHPWVHNVFLQILEDGRLSDGKGRLVDFCNTLIIMTSNIGSDKVDWFFSEEGKTDWYKNHLWRYPNKTKAEHLLTLVYPSLQQKFKPEILNRIDEVVVFESMNLCAAWQIAMLMVDKLDARLNDKLGIGILISIEACQKIAKDHFEPEFGARPIRRAVTKIIEDPITDLLLYKKVKRGDYLIFHTKDVENEPVEMRFVIPGDRPDRDESGNVKIWTLARESMPKTAAIMKKLYTPKNEQ